MLNQNFLSVEMTDNESITIASAFTSKDSSISSLMANSPPLKIETIRVSVDDLVTLISALKSIAELVEEDQG